ncbi:NAD-dependent epimerase/dehydratase family protein [bacterium]|nr:NAD-dependent epimerase/dehydratase family protein [bacterium]
MTRHLVTGGCGFMGNIIAKRLLEKGHEVRVLDRWDDPQRSPDIEFMGGDIRDSERVRQAMKGVEVVHHNAALVPLTKSGQLFWDVNVNGTRVAATEAARAGVSHFIHMSSSAVFGSPDRMPIDHQTPRHPVEVYGRSKLEGENAVMVVAQQTHMPCIIIRPRTIIGEGRLGIFQLLFQWIDQHHPVIVLGSGRYPFQFVHAHDLMDAYMLLMDHQQTGAFNIGTDTFGTLRELYEHLIAFAHSRSPIIELPAQLTINGLRCLDWLRLSPLAPWHYLTYHKAFHFDMTPLTQLGWKAQYSNQRMFEESYTEWMNRTGTSWGQSPHRRPLAAGLLTLIGTLLRATKTRSNPPQ